MIWSLIFFNFLESPKHVSVGGWVHYLGPCPKKTIFLHLSLWDKQVCLLHPPLASKSRRGIKAHRCFLLPFYQTILSCRKSREEISACEHFMNIACVIHLKVGQSIYCKNVIHQMKSLKTDHCLKREVKRDKHIPKRF